MVHKIVDNRIYHNALFRAIFVAAAKWRPNVGLAFFSMHAAFTLSAVLLLCAWDASVAATFLHACIWRDRTGGGSKSGDRGDSISPLLSVGEWKLNVSKYFHFQKREGIKSCLFQSHPYVISVTDTSLCRNGVMVKALFSQLKRWGFDSRTVTHG